MSTQPTSPHHDDAPRTPTRPRRGWRTVDIVTAAVLGVVTGFIFVAWNIVGGNLYEVFNALTPGLGGLPLGVWLLGGIFGGLIIRKPGAAIFVELIAAIVSMLIGNQWGVETIYSGLAQGIGAEIIFALFAYRRFSLPVAMLSGMGAAAGAWILEFFLGNIAKSWDYNLIYLLCTQVSGIVLAGLLGWVVVRLLASTGALDRFAVGRERRTLI
ncbi:ECF transporter S component [Corynebacterium uropygiale]|uniref:ECF transporter S component n=1 Tax=Corynebacterium uropygiale TaxID=1775911 RepID=UPI003B82D671